MKKTLIVIDMQNDFISMALGSPSAQAIVEPVTNKIRETLKDTNNNVVFTMDTHYAIQSKNFNSDSVIESDVLPNYKETIEGKNVPIHCIMNFEGWMLHPNIKALADFGGNRCFTIRKTTFGFTEWNKYRSVVFENSSEIEIIGLCTDICVISNALILRSTFPDKKIVVDASCCAGTSHAYHLSALDVLESNCIEVINRPQSFKKEIPVSNSISEINLKDGVIITPSLLSPEWREINSYININFGYLVEPFVQLQRGENSLMIVAVKYGRSYYWIKYTELSSKTAHLSLNDFTVVTPSEVESIINNTELKYVIVDITEVSEDNDFDK